MCVPLRSLETITVRKAETVGSFPRGGALDVGFACGGNDGISLRFQLKSQSVLKCARRNQQTQHYPPPHLSGKVSQRGWQNGTELSRHEKADTPERNARAL